MNPIIDNIKNRRSIRKYLDKEVPKDIVKEIIEAGRYAPSSHNSQPWRFIVITDRSVIKEVSDAIKSFFRTRFQLGKIVGMLNKKIQREIAEGEKRIFTEQDLFFYDAPCLIMICAKPERFSKVDCACAAQSMMLAARSLGIGSCWVGFADMAINKNRSLMAKLGVPSDCKAMAHLIFGYPIKFPELALDRKQEADVVKWI